MKLLRQFDDPESGEDAAFLLRDNGIATHTTSIDSRLPCRVSLYVLLDHQYPDAVGLLADPTHEVEHRVDVDEVQRLMNDPSILNPIFKWAIVLLLCAGAIAAIAVYLGSRAVV